MNFEVLFSFLKEIEGENTSLRLYAVDNCTGMRDWSLVDIVVAITQPALTQDRNL